MPLSEQTLQGYVAVTASVELSAESAARLAQTSAVVADALQALAGQSLFDSEPEQLHTTLEALADDDAS